MHEQIMKLSLFVITLMLLLPCCQKKPSYFQNIDDILVVLPAPDLIPFSVDQIAPNYFNISSYASLCTMVLQYMMLPLNTSIAAHFSWTMSSALILPKFTFM